MIDMTESLRMDILATTPVVPERALLEFRVGQVWDTDELCNDFTVESFLAPFVLVTRKADHAHGTLQFQPRPRFYHSFQSTA